MSKLLIANWKMSLNASETEKLVLDYRKKLKTLKGVELVIAPSFPMISSVVSLLNKTKLSCAGQNVAGFSSGAYTGEVSAKMLEQLGCKYVLVGHSERRQYQMETDEMVHKKIVQCYEAALTPVLCIGETLKEKEGGKRDSVIINQLHKALSEVDAFPGKEIVIAYEPVWAIGTGNVVAREDLVHVERIIKRALANLFTENFYNNKVRLLYGGSVNSANVDTFWGVEKISGFLVATASLKVEEFLKIALSMK